MAINPIDTIEGYGGKKINVFDQNYDNSKMDQEDFLKVLLANFKYQDPFETQDIGKFIDNTVKLRELEVMNRFEDSVKMLSNGTQQLLEASNLIGKSIQVEGGQSLYVQDGKSHLEVKVKEKADFLGVYLYDEENNIVYKKELNEDIQPGSYIPFDIDDPTLKDGVYKVGIVAKNAQNSVESTIKTTALVQGAERKDGSLFLIVNNGTEVDMEKVYKIGG